MGLLLDPTPEIEKANESNSTLLQLGIIEIRQKFSNTKTILLSEKVSLTKELNLVVPKQGDKKSLVVIIEMPNTFGLNALNKSKCWILKVIPNE